MIHQIALLCMLIATAPAAAHSQLEKVLPDIRFNNVPLADVVDFLRDVSGANIEVDWKALEAAGIERTKPLSARLRNIRFRAAVATILESASPKEKLACINDYRGMKISTVAALTRDFAEQTYDVQDLLGPDPKAAKDKAETLLALITHTIEPWTWQDGGGLATAKITAGKLTVTHTMHTHYTVQGLLAGIRALRE